MLLSMTLTLALAAFPPLAEQPLEAPAECDLDGFYTCTGGQGTDAYHCVAVVAKRGGSYHIKWIFDSGENAVGIGQRDGDRFWVAWSDQAIIGLARYRIEMKSDKPHLVGVKGTDEVFKYLKPLP